MLAAAEPIEGDADLVWKLGKKLPGRRAAGKHWSEFFKDELTERGFQACPNFPQIFSQPEAGMMLDVHMDDAHGTGPDAATITELIKDIGATAALSW